jgi:hypothetical protein
MAVIVVDRDHDGGEHRPSYARHVQVARLRSEGGRPHTRPATPRGVIVKER